MHTLHQFQFHLLHVTHKFDGYSSWVRYLPVSLSLYFASSLLPLPKLQNCLLFDSHTQTASEHWTVNKYEFMHCSSQTQSNAAKLCIAIWREICSWWWWYTRAEITTIVHSRKAFSHLAGELNRLLLWKSRYNPNVIVYHTRKRYKHIENDLKRDFILSVIRRSQLQNSSNNNHHRSLVTIKLSLASMWSMWMDVQARQLVSFDFHRNCFAKSKIEMITNARFIWDLNSRIDAAICFDMRKIAPN